MTEMNYDNETSEQRSARIAKDMEDRRLGWITIFIPQCLERAKVKPATWEKALLKITNGRTTDLNEMSYHEVEATLEEADRRACVSIMRERLTSLKSDGKCLRCGGAGQADKWAQTGLTCYSCNGSGKATPSVKF